ncbi:hypothetical protein NWE60_06075 [Mycoplasmopsis felis]|nr:hypothetical protein [Mycoplasmopsis felis]UWV79705.1 hypothetical protein NW072_00565 [Mycoplasmopsis felis]WAM00950.1 hypothetical protein NWE60_06075 [Mycoplasmopsis felis]
MDGTIYPFPSKELSEINQNKVKEVVSKGVEFVINTGNEYIKKYKN